MRLPSSASVSRCLQPLEPGLAPRSAPPHSDLVSGLSALTGGSLSSSRRSPRDSRTSQPSRRVNPKSRLGKSARRLSPPPGTRTLRQRPVSRSTRRCLVRTELDRLTTVTLLPRPFSRPPLLLKSRFRRSASPLGESIPSEEGTCGSVSCPVDLSAGQRSRPCSWLVPTRDRSHDLKLAPCRPCCVSCRLPTY